VDFCTGAGEGERDGVPLGSLGGGALVLTKRGRLVGLPARKCWGRTPPPADGPTHPAGRPTVDVSNRVLKMSRFGGVTSRHTFARKQIEAKSSASHRENVTGGGCLDEIVFLAVGRGQY